MSKESLLIKTLYRGKIDAETLRKLLRKVTHSVIGARAYVLKSYYNTSLLAAGVHPDWKRFFTGHSGDIEDIYSTRKRLPEWAIEKMREQFIPAVNQLSTVKADTREQEKAAALAALKVLQGYSEKLGIKIPLKEMKHQLEVEELPA